MRRLAALLLIVAACRTVRNGGRTIMPTPVVAPTVTTDELLLELKQTVTESYRTLAGCYDDAYQDGIARDPRVVLIDVQPDAVAIGQSTQAASMRRLFVDPQCRNGQAELVSKALEVHVSSDSTVAWAFDAIGYRVRRSPGERAATLPLRATTVFEQRDGRWLKVLEHVSYAARDDADAAEDDPPPGDLPDDTPPGGEMVRELIKEIIACDPRALDDIDTGEGTLLVGETTRSEIRGADIGKKWCPNLLFDQPATATPTGLRVVLAASGSAAWAAANLAISTGSRKLNVRATWVLIKGADNKWRVEQTHISAPTTLGKLAARVYGDEPSP
jgi:ketosteroid isomerase-like protein